MKNLLTICFCVLALPGYSQWNGNSTVQYFTGNVGIGTTTPSFKFHIRGGNANSDYMSLGTTSTGMFALTSSDGGSYGLFGGVSYTGRAWLQAGRYDTNTPYDLNLQSSGGNVGIGTVAPLARLHLSSSSLENTFIRLEKSNSNREAGLQFNVGNTDKFYFWSDNSDNDALKISAAGLAGEDDGKPRMMFPSDNANIYMTLSGGNVGVGTTNTGSFKLAVEGKIGAREVTITAVNPWPDYVFENNYNLPTLAELEAYIKINKHLPEVPTACAVEENGVNLGEMNRVLLKKVEELTLYMIEQNKKIELLTKEMESRKKQ